MNLRLVLALVIGLTAQALALLSYMSLAATSPDTSLKHVGFVVLAGGSAWAVRLLYDMGRKPAVVCVLVLAFVAPLMPALFLLPKASELISFSADYLLIYAQGVGMALLGYACLWLLVVIAAPREERTLGDT